MENKIIFAGFGGQGIMAIGKLLAYAGLTEGKEVSFVPAYGPEMRGGTANCSTIVSDHKIGSPMITDDADAVIAMNLPSLEKFESHIVEGGMIFVNASLVDAKVQRSDIQAFYVPANDIAQDLGNPRVANMVMLGAYLEAMKTVDFETVSELFLKVFGGNKKQFIPLNQAALVRGAQAIRESKVCA